MLIIFRCDISYFIDSQASVKTLILSNIRSKLVSSCYKELLALFIKHHKCILGNANELKKIGASLPEDDANVGIFPRLSTITQEIQEDLD